MKNILKYLLPFICVAAFGQTDSILVNFRNGTTDAPAPWYNLPIGTTPLSLKNGVSITAAATYGDDPWTDGSNCYLNTIAFESYHVSWGPDQVWTLSGFAGTENLEIRILASIDAVQAIQEFTANGVTSNQVDANSNQCTFMEATGVVPNGSGNVVITLTTITGDPTLANVLIVTYLGEPEPTHCDSITMTAPSVITSANNGASDGAINITPAGGTIPYTYNWNNNTYTTQDLTNIPPGSYTLILTDDSTCTETFVYPVPNIVSGSGGDHPIDETILLNVEGYLPDREKIIIVRDTDYTGWALVDSATNEIVANGSLSAALGPWRADNNDLLYTPSIKRADFSSWTTEGTYRLNVYSPTDTVSSYNFDIDSNVYRDAVKILLKGLYLNRNTSTESHGGVYGRAAGFPRDQIRIHNNAVSPGRPINTVVTAGVGLHDAADYNVYPLNYLQLFYNLMHSYERAPEFFDSLEYGLPEQNGLPDILNEVMHGLRYLMYAQDPYDGGIYSVETDITMPGFIMPWERPAEIGPYKYFTQKSTLAARNAAALLYMGTRIFEAKGFTAFADSCLYAADRANMWQRANPSVIYNMGSFTNPAIETGDYPVDASTDWHLLSAEEYITTGRQGAYDSLIGQLNGSDFYSAPSYGGNHEIYAYMSMTLHGAWQDNDSATYTPQFLQIPSYQLSYFNSANATWRTSLGHENANIDFPWGSNSYLASRAMMCINAYELTGNDTYLDIATNDIDYIMGRNATENCFITGLGHGNHRIYNLHHRQSVADGISECVPGQFSGGPNLYAESIDGGHPSNDYTGLETANLWLENDYSYSTNETAINWIGTLIGPLAALSAMYEAEEGGEPNPEPEPQPQAGRKARVNSTGKVYVNSEGKAYVE